MSTLRITIADGDHYDVSLTPFDKMPVRDFIRLAESEDEQGGTQLERDKNRLIRITGAPERFIRYMLPEEVERTYRYVEEILTRSQENAGRLSKVHETLAGWHEAHGRDWTVDEARAVMEDLGLFRPTITVNEEEFSAKPLGKASYGQWIDLEAAVHELKDSPESELYVRSLAIMMHGQDGSYPVQDRDEQDAEYENRCEVYTKRRHVLFMGAPWVDVMGCAAFFFFNDQRYAAICNPSMTRFRNLSAPSPSVGQRIMPSDGEPMLS